MLVAAYRLLAHVVRIMDGPVLVGTWEQPWIRTLVHTEAGRARHVRLPAAAALVHQGRECPVLLLPDLGTVPVASYRPTIRRLMDLRKTIDGNDELDELLLVVGVAVGVHPSARLAAWHSLLGDVARRTGEEPLHARVVPCPPGLAAHTNRGRPIGDQTEQALALIARHPLLTRLQLASLLGTSETRTSGLVRRLTAESWVRSIQSVDVSLGDRHTSRQRALLELTPSGRREAVRRLLLPAGVAARYHGLLGKPASTRRFLRHLAHTVGANDVFVAFADAARRETVRGGDDALEEWRSAAACARGRFRPDGYGCYRRGAWRFGFFVEYDRGTERPSHYAVKLAAYYRYRDSFAFRRDYDGFPTLLVVTTSDAAEARFAYQAHLTQRQRGSAPLAVLFTTTPRIEGHADGILGPIWRAPGADPWTERSARVRWLPGLPRAPTAKGGHATPSFRQAAA